MNFFNIKNAGLISGLLGALLATSAWAQPCPDKNVNYWQAFTPGGESDLSARHQQTVLKRKCPCLLYTSPSPRD